MPAMLSVVVRSRSLRGAALAAVCALLGAFVIATPAGATAPTAGPTFNGSDISPAPTNAFTPNRIAVEEVTGDVYVVDSANDAVDVFSPSGVYLRQLKGEATTSGTFKFGGEDDGVAVDNSGGPTQGNVYVDGENAGAVSGSRVAAFDAKGSFLWQVEGKEVGLNDLCGVAVDPSGKVWTADYYHGVQERSLADGSITATGPVTGESCQIAFNSAGALFLTNWKKNLLEYAPPAPFSGTPIEVDKGPGNVSVAVDASTGEIYTSHGSEVLVYDSSLKAVSGTPFASGTPLGVAVDSAHGTIFVSDKTNKDIEIWTRAGAAPKPYLGGEATSTVTGLTAKIEGKVNPAGVSATCSVEYGLTTAYGASATCASSPGAGSALVPVNAEITGLAVKKTYHYRLVATNANGTVKGIDQKFVTPATAAPTVTTGASSGITQTSATVAGTVTPNGANVTSCRIEYGASVLYGSQVPCSPASPGAGTSVVPVTGALAGLLPATEYHYRVVATNGVGTGEGADMTFKTEAVPPVEKPAEKPVEKPAEKPVEKPAEKPVVKKPLTRGQLLALAIKKCKKLPKHKQAACIKKAKKKYAPPRKHKKKK
jgi:hypothetical protein